MRELGILRLRLAPTAAPVAPAGRLVAAFTRIEPLMKRPATAAGTLRYYSRDPLQAENEASTVRGHRVERARTSAPQGVRGAPSNGDGEGQQKQQEYEEGRAYEGASLAARLANAWKSTPIKWYPIPVLLGACVLVGIQARRNYLRDRKGAQAKIVDENGKVVTMQGPWTVS